MKFVTYNIRYSKGKDGRYDLARIADALAGADVIALQEVVRNLPGVPDADQPARLAELLPDYFWTYGPSVDLDASERQADGRVVNKRLQFGNMILSRFPILSMRLILLPRCRTYDRHNVQFGALEGVINFPAEPLRVYAVHLNSLNGAERLAQIDYLLPRLLSIPREGGAVTGGDWHEMAEVPMSEEFVVMGDCNLTPGSPEYRRIVGEPDYYYGPRIVAQHLVDSWVQSGKAHDEGITWYDEAEDWRSGQRLDYGFVSAGLAVKLMAAHIDDQAPGSDHQPYFFELTL